MLKVGKTSNFLPSQYDFKETATGHSSKKVRSRQKALKGQAMYPSDAKLWEAVLLSAILLVGLHLARGPSLSCLHCLHQVQKGIQTRWPRRASMAPRHQKKPRGPKTHKGSKEATAPEAQPERKRAHQHKPSKARQRAPRPQEPGQAPGDSTPGASLMSRCTFSCIVLQAEP